MARVDFPSRTIFINIRELAQFYADSLQNTILDYSSFIFSRLEIGRMWHDIIQREYLQQANINKNLFCSTELFLSTLTGVYQSWNVIIRGRTDIVEYNLAKKELTVIEIKTSTREIDSEIDSFWEFQVLAYCWIFARLPKVGMENVGKELGCTTENSPQYPEIEINPQIISVNSLTGKKTDHDLVFDDTTFSETLIDTRNKLIDFLLPRINHVEIFRVQQDIPWFFDEFRQGQQENLSQVREALVINPISMQIGPPGTGKTAINLRSLLERAITHDRQIFYSSTKTSQQHEVLHIIQRLNVQLKNPLWSVFLLAKEKYCVNEDMDGCIPYRCKFFNNMKNSSPKYVDIFLKNPIADVELLKKESIETEAFCPYYKAKFLSGFADIVIGDQNFIFSPDVKMGVLQRNSHPLLFSKRGLPYLYLMDEAHNLPSRVRDELSLSLDLDILTKLQKNCSNVLKKDLSRENYNLMTNTLKDVSFLLSNLKSYQIPDLDKTTSAFDLLKFDDNTQQKEKEKLPLNLVRFNSDEGKYFSLEITESDIQMLKDSIDVLYNVLFTIEGLNNFEKESDVFNQIEIVKEILEYLGKYVESMYESLEGNIQIYYRKIDSKTYLDTYCLNIAKYINQELKGIQGAVFMSATLHPEFFYRYIFEFPSEIPYIVLKNYFPEENRKTIIVKDIQTRYQDINKIETIIKICNTIRDIYDAKPGKYLIFTPNLRMINQINDHLDIQNTLTQENFQPLTENIENNVIICALGSIFSEGVNIPNLSGVIIISPGVPPPSYKNSLLMEYYKFKGKKSSKEEAFDLAFKIPGLNKILQSAGRVHRKPEDKGIIFLLGERFAQRNYSEFYPPFLHPISIIQSKQIKKIVKKFWES